MPEAVIDASALLAVLNSEPGAEVVVETLPRAIISAINLSEVIAKLVDAGMPEDAIRQALEPLELEIVAFDEGQAYRAGLLRPATRSTGISLGDRACLSLAEMLGVTALTADRAWADLRVAVAVKVIR